MALQILSCKKLAGWMDTGWMDGYWVDGWMDGKAGLRIAYSNQKLELYSVKIN